MAGIAWMRTGTIAVTNGSKAVTGTDTIWGNGVINPGDIIQLPNGSLGEVETIASNTSLTLKLAYTGASASAQPYAIIRMLPSGNVAAGLAADLQALLQRYNVTLDALVDLMDSNGTVSFSDGTTTLSGLLGLRALAAAASESGAGRVELATAAETATGTDSSRAVHPAGLRSLIQSTTLDGTTGKLLLNGAFGMPTDADYRVVPQTTNGADTTTDWNVIDKAGWWRSVLGSSAGTNGPGGGTGYWYLLVLKYGTGTNVTQLALPYGTSSAGIIKIRARYNDVWTPWVELASSLNLSSLMLAQPSLRRPSYTRATVPAASSHAGGDVYVTDATGGASPAWSNGTVWTSYKTNAAI